ncbi:hypothetical protein Bca101_054560 [Brassica carinata]
MNQICRNKAIQTLPVLKGHKIRDRRFSGACSEILLTDSAEAVSTSRRALRASKIADSEFTSLPNGLKSRLVIVPPELAYGKKGVQEIPPNATVELDIELLSIKQSPFGYV